MEEAGDVLIPIREGAITKEGVKGDLASLVSGKVKGRSSDSEITIFKAVGLAFEDNAVGWMVYARALELRGRAVGRNFRIDLINPDWNV